MKLVPLSWVRPTDRLARSIYTSDGRPLLLAGVELRETYCTRLREAGIQSVYIGGDDPPPPEAQELLAESTRTEAVRIFRQVVDSVRLRSTFSPRLLEQASAIIDDIMDELLVKRQLLWTLADVRAMHDYHFAHAVSVTVLSLLTGLSMGYNQLRLKRLALGALLHDIGKALLPERLAHQADGLSPWDVEELRTHTVLGFQLLRGTDDVRASSAIVALEHHERFDGVGYPQGLMGRQTHEFSRIVAVANVFDHLTSDRPNRRRLPPYAALEVIRAGERKAFDPDVVEALVANIAAYPPGTQVWLNSGARAVVVTTRRRAPTRPIVRLLTDRRGGSLTHAPEIDLADFPDLFVARVEAEAPPEASAGLPTEGASERVASGT